MFDDMFDDIIRETERQIEETLQQGNLWDTGEESSMWSALPDTVWVVSTNVRS